VSRAAGLTRLADLAREIRRERPAIFHAHLTSPLSCKFGLVAARLAHVPAVVATAQLFTDLPPSRWIRAQCAVIPVIADRFIAVSNDTAQSLQEAFRLPSRRVCIIRNAIPVVAFNRVPHAVPDASGRARLNGASTRPVVLTAARLDDLKGHRYLLEAAAQVPEALFVLAGEGSERNSLLAQAQALGIADRVLFLGYRWDIPELLASCDLFVLPSLKEGLSLAILEAMAAGRPVIATAVGGSAETVTHGETGLLVRPEDPTALAEAIRTLLRDESLARRLADAGRAYVNREHTLERMAQQVMDVYDEILSS
jgi:glycosyltransferase involved in cell wall biosynthesis